MSRFPILEATIILKINVLQRKVTAKKLSLLQPGERRAVMTQGSFQPSWSAHFSHASEDSSSLTPSTILNVYVG